MTTSLVVLSLFLSKSMWWPNSLQFAMMTESIDPRPTCRCFMGFSHPQHDPHLEDGPWPEFALHLSQGFFLSKLGVSTQKSLSVQHGTTRCFGGDTPLAETSRKQKGVLGQCSNRFSLYFSAAYQFHYLHNFTIYKRRSTQMKLQAHWVSRIFWKAPCHKATSCASAVRFPGAEGFKEQGKDVVICHLEIEIWKNIYLVVEL